MSGSESPVIAAPLAIEVGGILDGRTDEPAELPGLAEALGRHGLGRFELEQSGDRFSLLPARPRLDGNGFDALAQARFLDALGELVARARPGTVESTLHCKLLYADSVVEMLFVCRGDGVEPLTRTRPRTEADAFQPAARPVPGPRRRDLFLAALALLVLGAAALWRWGLFERALAARSESLRLSTGPFGTMLALEADLEWGFYDVRVSRAAGYPSSPDDLLRVSAAAATLPERAACSAVGDGGTIRVELCDAEGHVLERADVSLAPLLADASAPVNAVLPGRRRASSIQLALGSGPTQSR